MKKKKIEQHITAVMAKIAEAASKHDLQAVQNLTRKAAELQELNHHLAAIRQRVARLISDETDSAPAVAKRPANGGLRKLPVNVTAGDISQNLLKLTPHIKRGKIKIGEELSIEAHPSGERFQTVVLEKGNKLRARGEIGRFFKEAEVQPDDYVLLTEETPGRWTLQKAPPGEYSRYV